MENIGSTEISNFDLYYVSTDLVTNEKQSYFKSLDGFVLKPGETNSIDLDIMPNSRFKVNPNSMYYKSANEMNFEVFLNAKGSQCQIVTIKKDAGGAEVAD